MKQIVINIIALIAGSVLTLLVTSLLHDTATDCVDTQDEVSTPLANQDSISEFLPIESIKFSWNPNNRRTVFCGGINKRDYDQQKEGLWISFVKLGATGRIEMSHYHRGVKHGIERIYSFRGGSYFLSYICNYKNGDLTSMISFGDNGLVGDVATDISPLGNELSSYVPKWLKEIYGADSIYQAYIVSYNRDGSYDDEGWIIYPKEEFEIEFEKVGKYIQYEKNGRETHKMYYPNSRSYFFNSSQTQGVSTGEE